MTISFRRVTVEDFSLLAGWLGQAHVARWWHHETAPEAIERDFGPTARGEEPAEDMVAFLDGRPLGIVQRCLLADYPEELAQYAAITQVPADTMIIDYLIGDPDQIGRGLGPLMIRSMIERIWRDRPDVATIMVAVVAANRASWRALEKAGLARVGTGNMEPDNPGDGPEHHIYRIDRGSAAAARTIA